MHCCVKRDKRPICAYCGTRLETHLAKVLLYFGIVYHFCTTDCAKRFDQDWREILARS